MYQIIIIDDEEKIAEGMEKLFPWEQIGFHVAGVFNSAVKALEYLEKHEVNVVFSDIEMPDMNGIALSKKLSERENVKVVLFSSHRNYDYFRGAIQNKVEDYLLKPIEYSALLECMSRVREKLDEQIQVKVEKPQGYYEKIIQSVEHYLEQNYQNATLEKASELVNMSPTYISKIYKEKQGKTFSERLLEIRMEHACKMLADINYKSYDIAYFIGYDNPKSFSRAFKSCMGMTPMEYRKAKTEER